MEMMVDCNFAAVFLGIETPDEASLAMTKKFQNTRGSLSDSIAAITKVGLCPMAGFIIGFDGEKSGAGDQIVCFVEQSAIPTITFAMLQALPNTALWHRLEKEGRMRAQNANLNQTALMNFVPTRPLPEIAQEYVEAFAEIYDAEKFLDQTYRCFRALGALTCQPPAQFPEIIILKAFALIIWRQGINRSTRWKFWHHLIGILVYNPKVFDHYMSVRAQNEHFLEYRNIVRQEIAAQLDVFANDSSLCQTKNAEKLTA